MVKRLPDGTAGYNAKLFKRGALFGANWQAKQMFSEEEVLNILYNWSMYKVNIELDKIADEFSNTLSYEKWFEQYKK